MGLASEKYTAQAPRR